MQKKSVRRGTLRLDRENELSRKGKPRYEGGDHLVGGVSGGIAS